MKELLVQLSFKPKEGENNLWHKLYSQHNNCSITVDFNQKKINYGKPITCGNRTIQNFANAENWVVLECVNRLLEKGYSPQNIILEKNYSAGHGHSARLDICVNNDDGQEYLLIECKTYGKEFNKELSNTKKDGGQLFTYFKFENKASIIMLYASKLDNQEIIFQNEIIKIEEDYRIGGTKDFYERWDKITKDNGVFDDWVKPYDFVSKALTLNDLVNIREEDSSTIFNQFLEILRHNVVSDKGNAFNKIFTLFLCKIYDESTREGTSEELKFQWIEDVDNHRDFQLRLTELYKDGMYEFLEKVITDFSETEFNNTFNYLTEDQRKPILDEFHKIRLEKNNEFAIKDVYDEKSFNDNAIVVKEVVELLQKYKLRYTKKQQYLSDFFELLLTTGLKQESGQFFTPVPIAQFIIKSLPIDEILEEKLSVAKTDNNTLLPYVIDYAAGSGHFLTEIMHEIQHLIGQRESKNYHPNVAKQIRHWQDAHFNWALQYVYGIEQDYRLVKVGKVGCYLHGDGLANVIHSDGLAKFSHDDYKGKLLHKDKNFPQENKQFDVVISNPPYSVSSFKNASTNYYQQKDFELYASLTDSSSEIECLFVERTKQLLKDGGMAGVILPSSILSNTGIYTKTREILLKYFEIIAITELGSNTFMATDTNTVVLFLRRRNNYDSIHLKTSINKFFENLQEVTMGSIENPISKYLAYAWEGINFEDYKTLLQKTPLQKTPNEAIQQHELYQDYQKIKAKDELKRWKEILTIEQQKLFYFVLTYPQKIVLIKTGEKKAEKQFLGYEFSNRRGSEGIHPIQRGKSIDECTQLFDPNIFDNPQKASTYIYQAFKGDLTSEIDETLKNNISRANLVDLMTFDRVDFEKTISLSIKKKLKIESQWVLKNINNIANIEYGTRIVKNKEEGSIYPVYGGGGETFKANSFNRENRYIISRFGMSAKCMRYVKGKFFLNDSGFTVASKIKDLNDKYLHIFLLQNQEYIYACGRGVAQKNIDFEQFYALKIPVPPKEIQQKIVDEIKVLEQQESAITEKIKGLQNSISDIIGSFEHYSKKSLQSISLNLDNKRSPVTAGYRIHGQFPYYGASGIVDYVSDYLLDDYVLLISEDGANLKARTNPIAFTASGKIWVNNHAHILKFNNKATHKLVELSINRMDISTYITGQAQPKLSQKNLNNIKIPLPSIAEQQKIVAKIVKIEAKIHQLEAQTNAIPQQKEAVLKKYL